MESYSAQFAKQDSCSELCKLIKNFKKIREQVITIKNKLFTVINFNETISLIGMTSAMTLETRIRLWKLQPEVQQTSVLPHFISHGHSQAVCQHKSEWPWKMLLWPKHVRGRRGRATLKFFCNNKSINVQNWLMYSLFPFNCIWRTICKNVKCQHLSFLGITVFLNPQSSKSKGTKFQTYSSILQRVMA